MACDEIILKLKSMSSEKYKANVVKIGIPESNSIGVSTGDSRKLAKEIKKSNEFAYELWRTGYHEVKLLAVLVFDKEHISLQEVELLMNDVWSRDLCDHLCKNLIIKLKNYEDLTTKWCASKATYTKRAAFTLMASAVIHEKSISDDTIDSYLKLIFEHSNDEREHVKKAVSWVLRKIGKRDFNSAEELLMIQYIFNNLGLNKAYLMPDKRLFKINSEACDNFCFVFDKWTYERKNNLILWRKIKCFQIKN